MNSTLKWLLLLLSLHSLFFCFLSCMVPRNDVVFLTRAADCVCDSIYNFFETKMMCNPKQTNDLLIFQFVLHTLASDAIPIPFGPSLCVCVRLLVAHRRCIRLPFLSQFNSFDCMHTHTSLSCTFNIQLSDNCRLARVFVPRLNVSKTIFGSHFILYLNYETVERTKRNRKVALVNAQTYSDTQTECSGLPGCWCVWERKRHRVHNHMVRTFQRTSVKWNEWKWFFVQMHKYHRNTETSERWVRTAESTRLTHFVR